MKLTKIEGNQEKGKGGRGRRRPPTQFRTKTTAPPPLASVHSEVRKESASKMSVQHDEPVRKQQVISLFL